jgi:putative redox protein
VAKAPTVVDLAWSSGLIFSGRSGQATLTLDSAGVAGPSPVQALAFALAGCMMMDVADILTKGRHAFSALRSHLVADRADADPHRILRVTLSVAVAGDVPATAVERAIALSREKYCSVWHSMRQDIEFTTSFRIEAEEPAS